MKIDHFLELYKKLQSCKCYKNVNSEKVLRKDDRVNFRATAMIISEAMAENQVRLSWVNFFNAEWNIGSTGKMLEKFLQKLHLTVYPGHPNTIYNTEIVHCFPGHEQKWTTKTIRRPSSEEIHTCVQKWFIQKEIELLAPKVIFLMGKTSYETFYEKFLGDTPTLGLTEKIESIKKSGVFDRYQTIPLIPIQHASGANPRYSGMLKDLEYIHIVRKTFLEQIFPSLWSREASYYPDIWTSENPSIGQCAVTSLVVQDLFGGDILNTTASLPTGETISHYYNRIDGMDLDCTLDQFPKGTCFSEWIEKKWVFSSPREYMLSSEDTRKRYLLLKNRNNTLFTQ